MFYRFKFLKFPYDKYNEGKNRKLLKYEKEEE